MTRAVNPDDLHWPPLPARVSNATCPVCANRGTPVPVVEVPSMMPPHQRLSLLRCAACGSGYFDPPGITSFSDLSQQDDNFWRLYVEVGGGLWETIWPVLVDRTPGRRSLLDVGCGFGYLVDYWRREMGGEAIGIELADYGAVGARTLDIPVHREMLQDCAELRGRQFEIVHASEVIEHVPDPCAFVRQLAPFVARDGVLVLTTPSMDYVKAENSSPTLLAALSPGLHGFLLSAQALADVAYAACFTHVQVRTFGERQLLWASRVPLQLDFALDGLRPSYFAYLDGWIRSGAPSSPLWQGYAYRNVRDLVNAGRLAEAKAIADRLIAAIKDAYGPAVMDPEAMTERINRCNALSDLGRIAPFFLPCLYFQLGVIAHRYEHDLVTARHYFRGTAAVGVTCAQLGSALFLEAISFIWPARTMDARIALEQGDIAGATTSLARLARDGWQCRAADGYASESEADIEAQVQRACQELARRGAWDAAREVFAAYLSGLETRYPRCDWTAPETVAQRVIGSVTAGPHDPVYPLFFQGLLDVISSPGVASHRRLQMLVDMASTYAGAAGHGARLTEYAAIARRLVPALVSPAHRDPLASSVKAELLGSQSERGKDTSASRR